MAGTRVTALRVAEDPAAWRALGVAVGEDGFARIGQTALRFAGTGGGLAGWALAGSPDARPAAVDGIPTTWDGGTAPGGAAHPLGLLAVDHVVVRTPDPRRTFSALERAGMVLRREVAGAGLGRPAALRFGFFRHGECVVEVVGPAEPDPADARPARLWGLTLLVEDLDAAAVRLGERLGSVRPAVQPGRRIATVREGVVGTPVALMSS